MRLSLSVLFLAISVAHADDKPSIVFPDVEGWAKGQRYDRTPGAPADTPTTISYTTKAKIGSDFIRVQIAVPASGGKSLKDVLPAYEKKIVDNPILKNTKKTATKEVEVNKTKVTQVNFSTTSGGDASEYVLHVIPYGDYFIKVEQYGRVTDSTKRATEMTKLLKALVDASNAK